MWGLLRREERPPRNDGKKLMTYFDEQAKNWDADPMKVERARTVADAIRHAVPLTREMSALEYGCGTGLLSFALQSDLGQITLADTSQGMLDVLAEKIRSSGVGNMRGLRLDLTVDPLPAEKFHITYSLMTLHHIPDTQSILEKFHALLKPNGILLVADLDKEDGIFHTNGETDIHKGFDRATLQAQVEAIGFTNVQFTTAYIVKKKIGIEEKSFPVFLMSAQKKE
jgi:ubiquinone/menaquinone biosynthesis C-methylase UbiE